MPSHPPQQSERRDAPDGPRNPKAAHPAAAKRAAAFALQWLLLVGVYHLFASKVTWHEVVVAAVAAVVAATASMIVGGAEIIRLGARLRDVAQGVRLPAMVIRDTATVLRVFFRLAFRRGELRSCVREVAFDIGGNDGDAVMRRALATTYSSATPNTIVIDFDRARGVMIYHQLEPAPVAELTRRLGARGPAR